MSVSNECAAELSKQAATRLVHVMIVTQNTRQQVCQSVACVGKADQTLNPTEL